MGIGQRGRLVIDQGRGRVWMLSRKGGLMHRLKKRERCVCGYVENRYITQRKGLRSILCEDTASWIATLY